MSSVAVISPVSLPTWRALDPPLACRCLYDCPFICHDVSHYARPHITGAWHTFTRLHRWIVCASGAAAGRSLLPRRLPPATAGVAARQRPNQRSRVLRLCPRSLSRSPRRSERCISADLRSVRGHRLPRPFLTRQVPLFTHMMLMSAPLARPYPFGRKHRRR